MRSLALLLFRWGARMLLPPSFPDELERELVATVAARVARQPGGVGLARIIVLESLDLLRTAGREWWLLATTRRRRHGFHGGGGWMNGAGRDLLVTARTLGRQPHLTVGVALTLGLGIGATTTIFSVVDAVVVRPLPYDESARLVAMGAVSAVGPWVDAEEGLQGLERMPWPLYRHVEERSRSFAGAAAIEASVHVLPDMGDGAELVPVARVTPAFFDLLGISPVLGRTFLPEEYRRGSDRVLVMSHGAWQRRFGGDPSVIGGEAPGGGAAIVGVLPRDFGPLEAFFTADDAPELFAPIPMDHERLTRAPPRVHVIARLADGATLAGARRELALLSASFAREDVERGVRPDGTPIVAGANDLHAQTVGSSARTLAMFFVASLFLLLIAAMNVATLLLARGLDRARDMGVRTALGASRARIALGALSEAVLLAMAGGVVGVAVAYGGVGAFTRFAPPSFPRIDEVAVEARVLVAAALIAMGAGVLAGALPALRLAAHRPWAAIRDGGGTSSGARSLVRSLLVAGQMALAVILLTGAGLLFGSFLRIRLADPGFEPDGVMTMTENIEVLARGGVMRGDTTPAPGVWQYWDMVVDAVAAAPGIESAGATSALPFQAPSWAPGVVLPGEPTDRVREGTVGYVITTGYLETVGTELRRGRGFTRQDGPDSEGVALVNEAFVAAHLEGREPVGAALRLVEGAREREVRIVGVVEDVAQQRIEDGVGPALYVPHTQRSWPLVSVVARSPLPPETLVTELRAVADTYNSLLPSRDQRPIADLMSRTQVQPRFQSALVGAFAAVATLLAAVGLFSSMMHVVVRRRREIGVRMALGAARPDVVRLVLREGMLVAGGGLLVGVAVAHFATRALGGLLYRVTANDPVTTTLSLAVLVLVSLVACIAPSIRATTVDPVTVLEAE